MIGKIVKVIVDRPLGSRHPKHKDIIYTVNYGYIPRVIGDKEAEQGLISVRHRAEGDLGTMTLDAFKAKVLLETAERRKDK